MMKNESYSLSKEKFTIVWVEHIYQENEIEMQTYSTSMKQRCRCVRESGGTSFFWARIIGPFF